MPICPFPVNMDKSLVLLAKFGVNRDKKSYCLSLPAISTNDFYFKNFVNYLLCIFLAFTDLCWLV